MDGVKLLEMQMRRQDVVAGCFLFASSQHKRAIKRRGNMSTNDMFLCSLSLTSGPDPLAGVFREVVTAATFPECWQTHEQISVTCQKLAFQ